MTDKSKNVNDIVSQTARALGSGKAFGGWTDKVEEDTNRRHVKKQHASMEREKKEKEEPLVIHGPDGTRKNPQYSKFIYPKDVQKESLNEGLVGGAASGAATGAMIGSVVPFIGTGIGAVVGGILGGVSGVVTGNKKTWKEKGRKLYGY
jgi:hypothetical protein